VSGLTLWQSNKHAGDSCRSVLGLFFCFLFLVGLLQSKLNYKWIQLDCSHHIHLVALVIYLFAHSHGEWSSAGVQKRQA